MKSKVSSALTFIFILIGINDLQSQQGPGGINSTSKLSMWLKADDLNLTNGAAVATWADATSNGNDAEQSSANKRPSFVSSSSMNSMPAVSFSGGSNNTTSDNLEVDDNDNLDNSARLTFYAAVRLNSVGSPNVQAIFGKRISSGSAPQWAYTWYFYTSNRLYLDLNSLNNRFSTSSAFVNNTNYLLTMVYDGGLATGQRAKQFISGALNVTASESSTSIINSTQNLYIGTMNNNYGKYFSGLMGELMIFNDTLSTTEKILVDNYLSAKYNTSLTSNNLYDEDDGGNGDFDYDVAGIGQNTDGTSVSNAQGTGMVTVQNPDNLGSGEWFIWGHDNGVLDSWGVVDTPAGVQAKIARNWRVSETGEVGDIDISFDLSDVPNSITTSDLRLLIDTDNDGVFSDETVAGGGVISGAVNTSGSTYQWTNVDIDDNQRFSIGSINESQTPLPVELIDFSGTWDANNRITEIFWSTASELNSDYFIVEHSTDGLNWELLLQVKAHNNSQSKKDYRVVDETNKPTLSYYRLTQFDLEGHLKPYPAIKVIRDKRDAQSPISITPNPVTSELNLSHSIKGKLNFKVINAIGQDVSNGLEVLKNQDNQLRLNVSNLKNGLYYIVTEGISARFIKE